MFTDLHAAFNHHSNSSSEAEYDRLRDLARQEAGKRSSCFDKVNRLFILSSRAGLQNDESPATLVKHQLPY